MIDGIIDSVIKNGDSIGAVVILTTIVLVILWQSMKKDEANRVMYKDMHQMTTKATEKVASSVDGMTGAVLELTKEHSKLSTQVEILRSKDK